MAKDQEQNVPDNTAPGAAAPDPQTAPYADPQGREVRPRHRRLAMRVARSLNAGPQNPDHALRLLAERDIDILSPDIESNPHVKKVLDEDKAAAETKDKPAEKPAPPKPEAKPENLPAVKKEEKVPDKVDHAKELKAEREREIAAVKRSLIDRRRRRLRAMLLRLLLFVFLPTAAVGYYYWGIATDMYETESSFVIQTSDNGAASAGLGGMLAGTGFATSQDSIVVQDFLQSREAFNRLEREFGFIEHFQNPNIDRIQRLPPDASLDDGFKLYEDMVKIGYDPTEGVIRMTVVATDPQTSQTFAQALVKYAEIRVDGLTIDARGDRLTEAENRYKEAEQNRIMAQLKVLELQQKRGILSTDVELQSRMQIINTLELQLEEKYKERDELLANLRPNPTQLDVLEREISQLERRITQRRAELTSTTEDTVSLAGVGAELLAAQTDLATRQVIEKEALASWEAARLEANRQVRYLSMAVSPVAPVDPTYPKKIDSTVLAFLVFSGIYILISLTVSILREQVSV